VQKLTFGNFSLTAKLPNENLPTMQYIITIIKVDCFSMYSPINATTAVG